MCTLKTKTKGCFDALDETSRLWQELEKSPPLWWKNLLEDKELYVEIRKDNYANAYYYGGNVALIRWTGREITAETHQTYLKGKDAVKAMKGKALYLDCREKLQTQEGLEEIKHHIQETYHGIHGDNNRQETREERDGQKHIYTSDEKTVQGKLKLWFPTRYIDSEFAYPVYEMEDNKLIRFDLVELRGKELVFIELKLITDSRLRSREHEPEIINQMGKYATFIKEHEQDFKEYYAKVLRIKKRLGLWDRGTEIESVSLKPELLIVNTYDKNKMSKGREERIRAMESLKERTAFQTLIVDYHDLCE